ncbi:LysR family transcriptional regulator [Paenibacillus sp. SYP-B4298]|uniref:LysR family transcriptional regulator n=1 Tax=Paenibacillus sp. SYP-B4298 TaxID=2996034 RepID=UPI0022DE5CC7|nr:LysR family transcriptional regulator [Paenibacillus sp. SYP-B4298]
MEMRHLHYFLAVAHYGSFSKAAQQLHVAQPTLSKMVRVLETELGVELFDRSAKRIELTDAGRSLISSGQRVIQSMDHLMAELSDVVKLKRGSLRLGLPPMVGGHFFPGIIERFHQTYPDIQVLLEEHGGRRIEAAVEAGELDAGLVLLPVNRQERFHMMPFIEEPLRCVLDAQHPLAHQSSLELRELASERFILFREEFNLHHLIVEACKGQGYEPNIVFQSSQWDFMVEMVAAKYGITLLPSSVCTRLDRTRYAVVPLSDPPLYWQLCMIWSGSRYTSYATREWIAFMEQEIARSRLQP